jgi:hypothetical protein
MVSAVDKRKLSIEYWQNEVDSAKPKYSEKNLSQYQFVKRKSHMLSRYSDWLLAGRSGIESRRGRNFPHLSRPVLGPTQPPLHWVPDLSWG